MKTPLLIALALSTPAPSFAADLSVVSIDGNQVHAAGDTAGIRVGDSVYFTRSPFKFPVREVKNNAITIEVPAHYDLKTGSTLYKQPNESIRKNMQMEDKLKHAIED